MSLIGATYNGNFFSIFTIFIILEQNFYKFPFYIDKIEIYIIGDFLR